eukprot:TRINITY_DN2535_c0_g1_i2.p2 TRINITY_DN2535_c0_g1~~TRINITY_DN2535_c0_g1_i2.p2  ORF type:complete len:164 (+),score=27.35 TRINITY_DN2535_c0_g1_i2:319-810(+)
MDVKLIPYGNAKETQVGNTWQFTCQHGPEECVGNLIESCALAAYNNNMTLLFPFIECVEGSGASDLEAAAKKCASQTGLNYAPIANCTGSSWGNQVQHEMAVITNNLQPPHQYTPWITLNGHHTDQIQDEAESHLVKLVCQTYTGTKPAGCSSVLKAHKRTLA